MSVQITTFAKKLIRDYEKELEFLKAKNPNSIVDGNMVSFSRQDCTVQEEIEIVKNRINALRLGDDPDIYNF